MKKKAISNFWLMIKKNWIAAMALLIVTTSISQCNNIIDYLGEGSDMVEQKKYDGKLDSSLIKRFNDPIFIDKMMNLPHMIDWRKNEKAKHIEEIKHKDATKLKMSAYVSEGSGMDKKAMMDTMVVMMNERKKGVKFVTNSQCIKNSKKYGRGQHAMQGL